MEQLWFEKTYSLLYWQNCKCNVFPEVCRHQESNWYSAINCRPPTKLREDNFHSSLSAIICLQGWVPTWQLPVMLLGTSAQMEPPPSGHVQSCSLDPLSPIPPDLFKLVHNVAHTSVGKRAFGIWLKSLLVLLNIWGDTFINLFEYMHV